MTKHLLRDLERLSDDLLRLTAATEDALSDALTSILARDVALAKRVIEGDDTIDRMEVRLEDEALKMLALHQPVAMDLRFIIAAIKINNDLERIADIATNIARRTVDLSQVAPVEPPERFEEMARRVREMVRDAIHSLVKRDSALAARVRKVDDAVDDLNREILRGIEERAQKGPPEIIPALLRWHGATRNLERVADLATNVAEDVLYLVNGEIIRHF